MGGVEKPIAQAASVKALKDTTLQHNMCLKERERQNERISSTPVTNHSLILSHPT